MTATAHLILVNANALTMDPVNPRAEAVAIAGNKIAAVGDNGGIAALKTHETEVIDCRGLPLLPGLNDTHCHLLATASALSGLDCSPGAVSSITQLLATIHRQAGEIPPGHWIRGYGLEPAGLQEGRYPTRWELDSAAPLHPVRLEHSGGHAAILNSPALAAAGIDSATPDPIEGVIDRESAAGEPTGLLLDMSGYLRERLGNTRSIEELEENVARLSERLVSYGITSVQDAGPNNGLRQWETFKSLTCRGKFGPRVTMMAGAGKLAEFVESGLGWASGHGRLRLGHAKLMLSLTTGHLFPAPEDLGRLADSALAAGFPFAVHAVEQEALAAVLGLPQLSLSPAIGSPKSPHPPGASPAPRNRIEHCAECPPILMEQLARSGATVVTQPGFIYWRGDNYLKRVEPALLPHLYAAAGMLARNIPLAFSSDAPVIDPSPWPGIYAAVTSRTASGKMFPGIRREEDRESGRRKAITIAETLHAYTAAGAWAEGAEAGKGMLRPGMLADLALLNQTLSDRNADQILQTGAALTIVGGRVLWRDGTV